MHRAMQVAVVAMIAVTSITAYHFWWRQRHHWHPVIEGQTIWSAYPREKPARGELIFKKEHRSFVDWVNVLADAEEKGAPIASLAATIWLDRRRREYKSRSGEGKQ